MIISALHSQGIKHLAAVNELVVTAPINCRSFHVLCYAAHTTMIVKTIGAVGVSIEIVGLPASLLKMGEEVVEETRTKVETARRRGEKE